jgi:nicotinamidase-related amidase
MASQGGVGLLRKERSALVVIDIQERLMPAIAEGDSVVHRAAVLIEAARTLEVPVIATEQYPKGLGPTVSDITAQLPNDAFVVDKLTFSAARNRDFSDHVEALAAAGRDELVICGVETHVCVMQTVAELNGQGRTIHLVTDACGSRAPTNKDAAVARMRGMGISCVTTEMVLFEWLEAAGTPAFKALSKLVR